MRTLLLAALLLAASPAAAQDYLRPDCRGQVAAARLPDALTANWYRRFWTGDCGPLHGCMGGSPNWNQVVGKLAAKSPPAQRGAVRARACRLGALIGREWVRPKPVRRIDTGDLRDFNKTLERAGDVLAGMAAVEAQARAKIGR
jgi:hypothetical protein